jgi:hypothetical protein
MNADCFTETAVPDIASGEHAAYLAFTELKNFGRLSYRQKLLVHSDLRALHDRGRTSRLHTSPPSFKGSLCAWPNSAAA